MLKMNFLTKIIWWSKSSHFNVLLIIRPALENGSCALGTEAGKVTLLCLNLPPLWKVLSPEYPLSQDTSHSFSSAMGEMTISVNFLYMNKRNWKIKKKNPPVWKTWFHSMNVALFGCGQIGLRHNTRGTAQNSVISMLLMHIMLCKCMLQYTLKMCSEWMGNLISDAEKIFIISTKKAIFPATI